MAKLKEKKYDWVKIVSAFIIFYFWGLIGIFRIPLPELMSEYYQIRIVWLAVGVLLAKLIIKEDGKLLARLKTKKIFTNYGVYESDGGIYRVKVGTETYCVLYEGINAEKIQERGNIAFICPESHLVRVGLNFLVKTELSQVGTIPAEVEQLIGNVKFKLYGTTVYPEFGELTNETVDLKSRNESLEKTVSSQRAVIAESMKMLADRQTIKTMKSEDFIKSIEKKLEEAR